MLTREQFLKHLRSVAPRHTYVLRLLRRLYEQLGDWEHLRELLPELRRRKVETEEELQRRELRTHRALLEQAFLASDERRLNMVWADVPGDPPAPVIEAPVSWSGWWVASSWCRPWQTEVGSGARTGIAAGSVYRIGL